MSKLTDREVQIAQMLADGLNCPLIAQELGISKHGEVQIKQMKG